MKTTKKIIPLFLFLGLILAACGSDDTEETGGAENDGTLTVYVGLEEEHAIASINQFTEDTGIDVDMVRMSTGEILAKIRSEQQNPQADIWYGGPADTFVAAKEEDLLQPYQSPEAEAIPEEYRDEEGYWTGIYLGLIGFATSQDFLDEHNLEAPASWDDLLDPAYKDMVVVAHPGSSGTAYTALYSILRAKGSDDAGFDYLKELDDQVQQYTTSGSAPGRMVGMNEVGAGILFSHNIIKFQKEGFDNIVLSFPEEGTGYEVGGVGIINGTPNEELAQEFIDWAVSANAQEVGQEANAFNNLTHPDAVEPEEAADLEEIELIDSDPIEAGERRREILDRWEDEVNN